jgi:hypothetical protein
VAKCKNISRGLVCIKKIIQNEYIINENKSKQEVLTARRAGGPKMATQAEEYENSQFEFVVPRCGIEKWRSGF